MTSQPGYQTIAIHIVPYNSRSKGNQTKNHAENEAWRLVPDLSCFFKKLYMRYKQVISSLVSLYFDSPHFDIQKIQTI